MRQKVFPKWVCLEPDPSLARGIRRKLEGGELTPSCSVVQGFLADLPADFRADTIIYVDVMEHIDDDHAEFVSANRYVAPGGQLVVVSPAHMWLYSPFDKEIGQFRGYNKKTFSERLTAPDMTLGRIFYLDSVGLVASLANRLILKQTDAETAAAPGQDTCPALDDRGPAARLWLRKADYRCLAQTGRLVNTTGVVFMALLAE